MQTIMLAISSSIQVIIMSIIPFIWWALKGRKDSNFFYWIGLRKIEINNKSKYITTFLGIIIFFSITSIFTLKLVSGNPNVATSQFAGKGISALVPVIIYAFIQTGLSEEIFFRGFLAKRLINKFDFNIGNLIQAFLFGLLHGIMFISISNLFITIAIILFTGAIGWFMGMINEKLSGGSILSSWLLHGIANVISSMIAMFNLI